jgi:hypothetical protein
MSAISTEEKLLLSAMPESGQATSGTFAEPGHGLPEGSGIVHLEVRNGRLYIGNCDSDRQWDKAAARLRRIVIKYGVDTGNYFLIEGRDWTLEQMKRADQLFGREPDPSRPDVMWERADLCPDCTTGASRKLTPEQVALLGGRDIRWESWETVRTDGEVFIVNLRIFEEAEAKQDGSVAGAL